MELPYLIQRAKFENRSNKKGIDQILSFDYMGSSEFEFGALPKSLKRVRENPSNYVQFQYSFKKQPNKLVTVFCKKEQQEFIGSILEQLADRKIWLKEHCDLDKYIKGEDKYANDFWWDIDNDWFFWKFNTDFDLKFKAAIFELDVNNFDNFTADEYRNNLLRLGAENHSSLVGKKVYYSNKTYGEHKILMWNPDRAEFLLDLDGQKFWSNPFKIYNCN